MKSQIAVLPRNGKSNGHFSPAVEVVDPREIYDPHFEGLVQQMLVRVGETPNERA